MSEVLTLETEKKVTFSIKAVHRNKVPDADTVTCLHCGRSFFRDYNYCVQITNLESGETVHVCKGYNCMEGIIKKATKTNGCRPNIIGHYHYDDKSLDYIIVKEKHERAHRGVFNNE